MGERSSRLLWVAKYAGGGLLSYATPRLAVGAGIPLDIWFVAIGGWFALNISREVALNTISVLIGAALLATNYWGTKAGREAIVSRAHTFVAYLTSWRLRLERVDARQPSTGDDVHPVDPQFGSPVQRAKEDCRSFWHVPIKLRHGELLECKAYLDLYVGGTVVNKIQLCWADRTFEDPRDRENLRSGQVSLVPVAWRTEEGNDRNGYFADARLVRWGERIHAIFSDMSKHWFKLRIVSGNGASYESPHFYIVRSPAIPSNGHFVVEIEYEGEGTQVARPRMQWSQTETFPEVSRQLSREQKDRKFRAVEKLRDQVRKMRPFINRGEQLQFRAWNAFATGNGDAYTTELRIFRDEFEAAVRELTDLRDQYFSYEDAIDVTRISDFEAWIRAMGEYLVTCQALSTYAKTGAPQEAVDRFVRHEAEEFHKAVLGYIHWHNHARVCLDQIYREVAT